MEPNRGSYPEESESQWFRGEQQHPEPGAHGRFEPNMDEGGYRAQDLRGGARVPAGPPPERGGPAGQWTSGLRPPVAYVTVALVMFVAAGLAAS